MNATWRIETGNGTSALWQNYNNAGGIKCGNDYCRYKNKEHGYNELKELLLRYRKKYGFDLEAIRYEYCGSHCGEKDLQVFTEIFNEERNN